MKLLLSLVCFFILSLSIHSFASLEEMALELSSLRQKIASLETDIKSKKMSLDSEIKMLSMERAEVEAQKRNILKNNQVIKKEIGALQKQMPEAQFKDVSLVLESLEALEKRVKNSLPFKKQERLKSISDLKSKLEDSGLNSQTLSSWIRIIQEEDAMSSDISLVKKTISLGSQKLYSDVLKLGMSLMYFKTGDGRFGAYVYKNGDWQPELIVRKEQVQSLRSVFAAVKKNMSQAHVKLPVQKSQFFKLPSMAQTH